MKNIKKTAIMSLISILILGAIGPFSLAYARRTLTITFTYNTTYGAVHFGDSYEYAEVGMSKDISIEIEPKPGYHIHRLWVDTSDYDPDFNDVYGSRTYTFVKVKTNHELHVVFAQNAVVENLPSGSTASIGFVEEGDFGIWGFQYLPGTSSNAIPFFVEVTGTLYGTATVKVYYDDSVFNSEEEEELLRLYVGNAADLNGDLTVNGNDISIIQDMQGVEINEETQIYDINGDGQVDIIDVNIVKEYANSGLVVSPGNYNGEGEYRVPWIDITKGINTIENYIWGETWHFSIFGCR